MGEEWTVYDFATASHDRLAVPGIFTRPAKDLVTRARRNQQQPRRAQYDTVNLNGATLRRGRVIRCYDYVNHPYAHVRDALRKDALTVFQSATKSAASRAESIAAGLNVDIGAIKVQADIRISIKNVEEKMPGPMSAPTTWLRLEWEAATRPRLFPLMKAELAIYPLTATETQLDFSGRYEPPFGALGKAMNAIVGYRIAEVSVHRFVSDLAGYLRKILP
jgi:hypothetical protein